MSQNPFYRRDAFFTFTKEAMFDHDMLQVVTMQALSRHMAPAKDHEAVLAMSGLAIGVADMIHALGLTHKASVEMAWNTMPDIIKSVHGLQDRGIEDAREMAPVILSTIHEVLKSSLATMPEEEREQAMDPALQSMRNHDHGYQCNCGCSHLTLSVYQDAKVDFAPNNDPQEHEVDLAEGDIPWNENTYASCDDCGASGALGSFAKPLEVIEDNIQKKRESERSHLRLVSRD